MDAALKWTLNCSGRKVEDVLYMYGSTLKYEHLCHSFVLDPWDKTYEQKSVFTTAEIQEIKSSKSKKMPAIDDKVLKYLDEYKELKSSAQVRHFINRLQPWDANFDRKESHDMDWIRHSYYTMVRELERGGIDDDNNSETWLLAHIWTIVDRVFDDVQLDVVRGENSSHASSSRKNKERVPQGDEKLQKKKMGPRLDLILRRKRLEFGAGEAGKQTDDTDSKLLQERDLKLPKALKDMMMLLKNERGSADGLRVVGLLQYGW
ncbi:hypothetical protein BDC45DRAFT_440229 [Circinella umbellata]|nr:hypothetical protein BDC45DRAFT_440229 [Circinella umbellata]